MHKCKIGSLGYFSSYLTKILLLVSQSVYGIIVSSVLWSAEYPGIFCAGSWQPRIVQCPIPQLFSVVLNFIRIMYFQDNKM